MAKPPKPTEPLVIHPVPCRESRRTRVVEIRAACADDAEAGRYVESALDTLRELGAAVIIREGVIDKPFNDWRTTDLERAVWEGDKR